MLKATDPSPLGKFPRFSVASLISASLTFMRPNHDLPSGVARNLRVCILRLLRFVTDFWLAFLHAPPYAEYARAQRKAERNYNESHNGVDHYC
ncbi:hypothetical protein ACFH2V_001925 [Enterobacter kobei]